MTTPLETGALLKPTAVMMALLLFSAQEKRRGNCVLREPPAMIYRVLRGVAGRPASHMSLTYARGVGHWLRQRGRGMLTRGCVRSASISPGGREQTEGGRLHEVGLQLIKGTPPQPGSMIDAQKTAAVPV